MCERLGLTAGAGDPGDRPRPPRRAAVRVRVARRGVEPFATEIRHLQRTEVARGGGAVPRRRAEGLERDAAQAQPGEERAALRAGARAARQPRRRARERRALARARHLALVGRAHHPARLVRCSPTTCWCSSGRSSRACTSTPSGCSRTSTRRYGLVFSQPVLLALVESGLSRDDAVPRGAAQRDCAPGRSGGRSSTSSREDPDDHGDAHGRAARRVLRPEAGDRERRPHVRGPRRADRAPALSR